MDEKEEGSRSIGSDIMIRRMKNRERQRRYRERKRLLEARNDEDLRSSNRSCVAEEPKPRPSGYVENLVRRVYCGRDWKKDARRAHLVKEARDGSINSSVNISEIMTCRMTSEASQENKTIRHGRRDWKAEARNQKN